MNLITLPAGYILTASASEGTGHIRMVEDSTIGARVSFAASKTFGPYLVERNFTYSDEVSVSTAASTDVNTETVLYGAGAPEDAAQATLTVNPTGDDNGLIFTAREYGSVGNSISVTYTDPSANDAALSVSVYRNNIDVSLATGSGGAIESTAADVLAAVAAYEPANRLVSVAIMTADSGSGDDGSGVVTAMAKASLAGGAGTGIGSARPGCLYLDTTNKRVFVNTGTTVAPSWGSVAAGSDVPYTVDIALAASATTDGMDITITIQDGKGETIAGVYEFEWWISEAATGIGLTADTYSGDVTAVTGTEWEEIVTKKHYRALTAATGIFSATAVASANPTDQYIAVRHPVTGKIVVSAASGTNWEGAA